MRPLKDKIQFFVIGLFLGLLVGGGFFIFKLDDYFRELRSYKNSLQEKEKTSIDVSEKENNNINKVKLKSPYKKKSISNNRTADSTLFDTGDYDLVVRETKKSTDSLVTLNKSDSLHLQAGAKKPNEETIIIRKDELLDSKYIDLFSFNPNDIVSLKDSIIEQISGMREEAQKFSYKIEFWKSPINYKGYKMAKNKIVLYGVNPSDAKKLYKFNDNIYLKSLVSVYKLDYSGDFRQFEKMSDESLLAKLKL